MTSEKKQLHDTAAAVDFLKAFRPEGPWVLTSIVPDGKTNTNTFAATGEGLAELLLWVGERQGKENIYFTVNPSLRPLKSKAKKADIKELAWLHVDLDPRAGEPLNAERERALRLLREHVPPPTVIVDSGGGYQGFWKLQDPLPINGDELKAEEAEAYNLQLELTLGADACHNADRIMRLPGTVNVPNRKKKLKGREPAPALMAEADWTRVYPVSRFTRAQKLQAPAREGTLGAADPRAKLRGGNVERLTDVEALGEKVSAYTKMLIVQGDDPDDPTKYGSRSEVLMRVCCDLVRAGVPDEVIFAVITDHSFGISVSVLDKARSEKYALRQIERAREEAINPMLRELNEKHAVISDIGGRCRIISEVVDHALNRPRISRQSFEDFRNRYRHIRVTVGQTADGKAIEKAAGSWWVDHPMRRQYDTIVFAPGRDVPNAFNLWKGFACDAIPGDCTMFLDHMKENICNSQQTHFDYLLKWMARAVQYPDRPGEAAVVLRGKQGTGKSFFAREFGRLWGRHFLQVSDPKHLVGSFNAHLRDTVVLFGDEAFYAGDKKHESVLRMLVTEELITIEAKGIDAEAAPNYTHIILASNNQWVVPAGAEERRFLVLDVAETKMQDVKYFTSLKRHMEAGGREALLHHLLAMDIAEFNVRTVPQTGALREQKLLTLSPEEQWWFEKLWYGRVLERLDSGWEREVPTRHLQNDYVEVLHRMGIQRKNSGPALGRFLGRSCPVGFPKLNQRMAELSEFGRNGEELRRQGRAYFYTFPSLEECRQHWDRHYGGPFEWPPPAVNSDPV